MTWSPSSDLNQKMLHLSLKSRPTALRPLHTPAYANCLRWKLKLPPNLMPAPSHPRINGGLLPTGAGTRTLARRAGAQAQLHRLQSEGKIRSFHTHTHAHTHREAGPAHIPSCSHRFWSRNVSLATACRPRPPGAAVVSRSPPSPPLPYIRY